MTAACLALCRVDHAALGAVEDSGSGHAPVFKFLVEFDCFASFFPPNPRLRSLVLDHQLALFPLQPCILGP